MQDRRFYCQYHCEYELDTNDCRELRRAIEQLIQNRKLKKSTDTARHRDSEDHVDDKLEAKKAWNEVAGFINMIVE